MMWLVRQHSREWGRTWGHLVSFHPISGSDVAWGQTWAGLVGFYPGLGNDLVQSMAFAQAGMKGAALGGIRADLGDDVALGLLGFIWVGGMSWHSQRHSRRRE